MIDLDILELAAKKPWFTRNAEEDRVLHRVADEDGLIEIITRLRQAEKDAARYRFIKQWNQSYSLNVYRKGLWDDVVDKAMWMESPCRK